MRESDREAFSEVIHVLAKNYNRPVDPVVVKIWWSVLKGLDIDAFKAAAEQCIRESEFMPTPAKIMKAAESVYMDRRLSPGSPSGYLGEDTGATRDELLKGFRHWPVGDSARHTIRGVLKSKHGYEMTEEEFTQPQREVNLKRIPRKPPNRVDELDNPRKQRVIEATNDYMERYGRD